MALIMIVDDNCDTLTALQMAFSLLGLEVKTAQSGQEALRGIEERIPDLIITDGAMPTMSGLELCQVLRNSPSARHVPVVLHTGADVPNDVPRLYDRIITKPADITAFVKVFRDLLPPGHLPRTLMW